jgi:ParB family transcriptional regulator, chromosome partitioning protein
MSKNDPRKALGKGLHSLLPTRNAPVQTGGAASASATESSKEGSVSFAPTEQLTPNPNQPRRDFDPAAMAELTRSIERDGIIQPIIVRRTASGEYQIIAGERRWRAATAAGLKTVPVIAREASDEKVLELAIIENIQREDLNPIELAQAFHRMGGELGLSHDQIGEKTGKDRVTVTNTIRLLQLPDDLQQLVAGKQISQGHARALLKLADQELQRNVAAKCIAEGWSVRQTEEYTRSAKPAPNHSAPTKPDPPPIDPNVKAAVSEMEAKLGTRVRILEKSKTKGLIEIEYYSSDDLDRIYNVIVGETS